MCLLYRVAIWKKYFCACFFGVLFVHNVFLVMECAVHNKSIYASFCWVW